MLKRDNVSKVLSEFFKMNSADNSGLQLREIGRKIDLAPTSVKKYLREIEGEGIITRKKHSESGFPVYFPNYNNKHFHYLRGLNTLHSFRDTGMIESIEKSLNPLTIVVSGINFGHSPSPFSEVRLFLKAKKRDFEFGKYESQLNVKIVPVFFEDFAELGPEMKMDIVNGVVLKGVLNLLEEKKSQNDSVEESENGFYSRTFK